jgi:uncharacterized protein YndB with AHSA1/START domain
MSASTILTPADEPLLVIARTFDAPRALVYKCYTDPAHMVQFWGPHGSSTPVCRVDLRPGGLWRTVMRFADGGEFGYSSVYLEIVPPERLVWRDAPDHWEGGLEGLPPVEIYSTLTLADEGGKTRVIVTVRFNSIAERDENVGRGFAGMVTQSSERLETYLGRLQLDHSGDPLSAAKS